MFEAESVSHSIVSFFASCNHWRISSKLFNATIVFFMLYRLSFSPHHSFVLSRLCWHFVSNKMICGQLETTRCFTRISDFFLSKLFYCLLLKSLLNVLNYFVLLLCSSIVIDSPLLEEGGIIIMFCEVSSPLFLNEWIF